MNATLCRLASGDDGTFGRLTFSNGWSCATAELPWRANKRRMSCIPAGVYACKPYPSGRFGRVYMVMNVPGRSGILIHSGNHAGDVDKGFRSDVRGCILVGKTLSPLWEQMAVRDSRATLRAMHAMLKWQEFELTIKEIE